MVTTSETVPPHLHLAGSRPPPGVTGRADTSHPRDLAARTLLVAPRPAAWFTSRPRLLEVLDAGEHLPLVLVSASAGTGKTSLVADWLDRRTGDGATGWVTLQRPDDALWPLLLASLQGLGVPVPGTAEDLPDHPDSATLTSLAATLAGGARPVRVVIDGFEAVPEHTAEDLDLLLRCANGGLRLVVVTRVDPAFRLYRHRLEGSVVEVRDRDLAFEDEEARLLLERAGVTLSPRSLHDLNVRVRGWATGLRFASRALVSAPDPDETVIDVVSHVSDINEYLLGEVLDAQPPALRRLLLTLSVPDTLFPGLVEELVGPGRPVSRLTGLNAFLEAVSGAPGCYHYHPFFRDLLRAELAYESPDLLRELHQRTGTWLVRHGLLAAGVQHLADAGCWELAAEAVLDHLALASLLQCREDDPLVRTFDAAPSSPSGAACLVVLAGLALGRGRPSECGRLLTAAREAAAPAEPGAGSPRTAAAVALLDAVRARDCDSPDRAAELAERARGLLDRIDGPTRAEHPELVDLVTLCRAVAQIRAGDLGDAGRTLAGCAATAPTRSPERLHALAYLALVDALQGHLSRATDNATLALGDDVEPPRKGVLRSSAGEVALALVALERLDLDAADAHVAAAAAGDDTSAVCRGLAAMAEAGVHESRGRSGRALELIAAARAALPDEEEWLDGRLAVEAARLRLATDPGSQVPDDLPAADREPQVDVLVAGAHLGAGHLQAAGTCLERVRGVEVPLHARVLALLLEAARESRQDSPVRAHQLLDLSLRLAAAEHMRRPFAEAPTELQQLLVRDPRLASLATWLDRRTAESGTTRARPVAGPSARPEVRRAVPLPLDDLPVVIEPLTAKELEVLAHLEELLSTQEIAASMFISVNTVRTHVRNILRKLGVSRRSAAVRRARQLQIV